jgi:hypothetical protein
VDIIGKQALSYFHIRSTVRAGCLLVYVVLFRAPLHEEREWSWSHRIVVGWCVAERLASHPNTLLLFLLDREGLDKR